MVQLPRLRDGAHEQQQLRRHRRVRLVRQRLPVQQRARGCARAAAAAAQLRRRRLGGRQHPRPPGARALGEQPQHRRLQLRPLLRQGQGAALEQLGQRQLGDRAQLRHRGAEHLQPDAHRQRRARAVPARRSALRCAHRCGPVPGQPASARARARHHLVGRDVRAERQRRGLRHQRCTGARVTPARRLRRLPRHRRDARRPGLRRARPVRPGPQARVGHLARHRGLVVDGLLPGSGRRRARSR